MMRPRGIDLSLMSARLGGMKPVPASRRVSRSAMASAVLALGLCATAAWAARPMITDDARIVDPQSCQVETWLRANQGARGEYWAIPGCNPTGNIEWSAGGGLGREAGDTRVGNSLVQAKTLLRPLRTNEWGLGLTLGRSIERASEPGDRNAPAYYLNLPASLSLRDDDVVLHLNAGARRERLTERSLGTWGLASEIRLQERTQLIVESFGETYGRTLVQGGVRWWVVPDRVQVDATLGSDGRGRSGTRWASIGLRLLSPAFLPGGR